MTVAYTVIALAVWVLMGVIAYAYGFRSGYDSGYAQAALDIQRTKRKLN